MSEIICVTNRRLCCEKFENRMQKIAEAKPYAVILREKDLSEEAYEELAVKVLDICQANDVLCILHNFPKTAAKLKVKAVHLPMSRLRSMSREEKAEFRILGTSCHTVEEAQQAQKLGCTYLTAGHIFETDCKKGIPGRGTDFLKQVCQSVQIPVFAIGGISSQNFALIKNAGAKGGCVMSGFMQCENVKGYMEEFANEIL